MNGYHDKVGNEFERDYVVARWLELLAGSVDAVTWESVGADGKGVDLWVEDGQERIAIQCKKRDHYQWPPKEFGEVVRHARLQLSRADRTASRFLFVTNASGGKGSHLLARFRSGESPGHLSASDHESAQNAGLLDSDDSDEFTWLVERFEFTQTTFEHLSEQIEFRATLLCPNRWEHLVDSLRAASPRSVLKKRFDRDGLIAAIGGPCKDLASLPDPDVASKLSVATQAYIRDLASALVLEPRLERSLVGELVDKIRDATWTTSFLVHGSPGSGKSMVIADAARRLLESGTEVTLLHASEMRRIVEDADRLRLLRARGIEHRPVWFIDQVDEVMLRQAGAADALRTLAEIVELASRLRVVLVVCCRTVDAEQDTRLLRLLRGAGTDRDIAFHRFRIGDLSESEVTGVLNRLGVPWTDIRPRLRTLLRNPLCLSVFSKSPHDGAIAAARSRHEVARAWLQRTFRDTPNAKEVFERFVDRLQDTGVLSVSRSVLDVDDDTLEALTHRGVFRQDDRGRVHAAHQVLVDAMRAARAGKAASLEQLLQRLGPRSEQGLIEARTVRDAASLYAENGLRGAAIADGVMRSSEVRPVVQRGLLLGLAEVDELESPRLTEVVVGWLDSGDADLRDRVLRTLVQSNSAWTRRLRHWIDRAWRGGLVEEETLLILLAAISGSDGDFVADLLKEWLADHADLNDRLHVVFQQDPLLDSERLFQLRMNTPPGVASPLGGTSWRKLFSTSPMRAGAILRRELSDFDTEQLTEVPIELDTLPALPEWEALAPSAVREVWGSMASAWRRFDDLDVGLHRQGTDPNLWPAIEGIVVGLAGRFAASLDGDLLTFGELRAGLPEVLRDVDRWLLLETASQLQRATQSTTSSFVSFLTGDPGLFELEEYSLLPMHRTLLVRAAEHLGAVADDASFEELERWSLELPSDWSAEQEGRRWFLAHLEGGELTPTGHGWLCWQVLRRLPSPRLSTVTLARLAELERKFGGMTPLEDVDHGSLRPVAYVVPPRVVRHWSPAKWIDELRSAPARDPVPRENDGKGYRTRSRDSLIRLLMHEAERDPARYLPLALEMAEVAAGAGSEGLADDAFMYLLSGLVSRGPDSAPSGENAHPLTLAQVSSVLQHPAFLHRQSCAREVATVVCRSPDFDWPHEIVDRCVDIARGENAPATREFAATPSGSDDIETSQTNDARCMAIEAVGRLVQAERIPVAKALSVARRAAGGAVDPVRAAGGVLGAVLASSGLAEDGVDCLLTACRARGVAASHDCMHALRWAVRGELTAKQRGVAIESMLSLCGARHVDISRIGGSAAAYLLHFGLIDAEAFTAAVQGVGNARAGAAKQLAAWIGHEECTDVDVAQILSLAQDGSWGVTNALIDAVIQAWRGVDGLPLFDELLGTKAGGRRADDLLDHLDKKGSIEHVADRVAGAAASYLDGLEDEVGHRRNRVWFESSDILERLLRLAEDLSDRSKRSAVLDLIDRFVLTENLPPPRALDARIE